MIKIFDSVIKRQPNFWNQCVFHPTDAVEDPWGKRILDRMAKDGAIQTLRIYTMFEDIVYLGEDGSLQFDFRLSDLRLDYLVEKGYSLMLAYAGIPDCIASDTANLGSFSKNKTRYKGKMWNSAPPRDFSLWEEICYQYTKHNVERYGIETVSKWRCHCFNEPDIHYLLGQYPAFDSEAALLHRLPVYCKLYEAFERGIRRVSEEISIGGPALAVQYEFLGGFLDYVKEKNLKLDFISHHHYSTSPQGLKDKIQPVSVSDMLSHHGKIAETAAAHGFGQLPVVMDEWGMASCGFKNREECPELMIRETEVFSAYFARLIHGFVYSDHKLEGMMICLSGQHEMTEDFTGFRNFFTLNFIAKPIYNAYILASKLHESILPWETDSKNTVLVPTKGENGDLAVLLSYSSEGFEDDLPEITQTIDFATDISGKTVTVWCIDKETTNPYRLYQKLGIILPTPEQVALLQEEGRLKPVKIQSGSEKLTLRLSANCTYFITAN